MDYSEVFSLSMNQSAIGILEKAADCALRLNALYIGTEHLLYAILESGFPPLISALKKADITPEELKQRLLNLMRETANKQTEGAGEIDETANSRSASLKNLQKPLQRTTSEREERIIEKIIRKEKMMPTPALDHFTLDLTSREAQKKLNPLIGREKEMMRLINILSRKEKNNPLLLGEPGVGKTAVVEGLAQRIVSGEVPEPLKDKQILMLDLGALIAGTKFRGEFEDRLKAFVKEIKNASGQIMLFIDEIHTIVGAGAAEGAVDASNLLKPALARGELHAIGATTIREYQKYIEKDAALERRFQPVTVEEPNIDDSIAILRGLKEKYEVFHGVRIKDSALISAAILSDRYISDRFLPEVVRSSRRGARESPVAGFP
jgi:ATP-dependent Clp protease ATP-binding subunit ClpA